MCNEVKGHNYYQRNNKINPKLKMKQFHMGRSFVEK